MTGDPMFIGPIEESKNSAFCPGGTYTDFRFDCQVQYPQQAVDDGARFKVSLVFDGKTDPDNAATHVITDGTSLTVSFPSIALKGNVGKDVTIVNFLSYCLHLSQSIMRCCYESRQSLLLYNHSAAFKRLNILFCNVVELINPAARLKCTSSSAIAHSSDVRIGLAVRQLSGWGR